MDQTIALKQLLSEHTREAAPELVRREGDALRCLACGHRCLIQQGRDGICKVRFNDQGALRVPFGYVAALQCDPIEKKPFFHAYPGRNALSFGMLGCDLHCAYCQNWVTSQALRDRRAVSLPRLCTPEALAGLCRENDAPVLVSTYNEPLITSDWAVPVFQAARRAGVVCGYVSNGNATPEVLDYIRPYVDLYKVDLKSFDDKHYRQLGCTLGNVLESIERIQRMGFWLEIVTLVVPGFNDRPEELRDMARFIAGVSPEIPWHVTAFHPDYKMDNVPATTVESLIRAYEFGKEAGLRFIYPGNLPGRVGNTEDTYCPGCNAVLIERIGFYVLNNRMKGNLCPDCGTAVPGVWEAAPPRRSDGPGIPQPVRMAHDRTRRVGLESAAGR